MGIKCSYSITLNLYFVVLRYHRGHNFMTKVENEKNKEANNNDNVCEASNLC